MRSYLYRSFLQTLTATHPSRQFTTPSQLYRMLSSHALAGVNLLGSVIALMIWGFYICLFIITIWVLRSKRVSIVSPLGFVLVLIFLCNLGSAICDVFEMFNGFILYPEGPGEYYPIMGTLIDNEWVIANNAFLAIAAYFGDLLMAWRLYIIWTRDKRVLYLPSVLFVLGAVGVVMVIVFDALERNSINKGGFHVQYRVVSIVSFAITLALSWYSTVLICFRLWSAQRKTMALREGENNPTRYYEIIWVLIQSGMLYSITLGMWLVAYIIGNYSVWTIMDALITRIVGINTALIVLQLSLRTTDQSITTAAKPHTPAPQGNIVSLPVFRTPTVRTISGIDSTENFEESKIDNRTVDDVTSVRDIHLTSE
ncbi:hypothetical protein FRB94_013135 [Tulasnella sp. JGI-2019a]|nr:hypothetical protein FRB93_001567 [Tulasnella sp. JGI-2019a]KAG9008522.1 hypothetical protein FRB94_013135 [Tulasnella sp. JGI-2019a]KAG9034820.1 hypothetical protein FRB95_012513 [Tulasnella sp. JGI-2019a]